MKRNLPIILIVLSLIVCTAAIIFAIINHREKTLDENVIIIRDIYGELSNNVTDNILIRKDVIDKLSLYNLDTYADEHNEYQELMNKYIENVKKIDSNIETLDSICDVQYEDNTTNVLCRSYDELYEEVVNIYITNINNYNNKLIGHNQKKKTNYTKYELIHEDYVDLNKDGTYQGL